MALRVKDAGRAREHTRERGARVVPATTGPMELNTPAIEGIGGALVYLVDRYGEASIYDIDFQPIAGADPDPTGFGLKFIDHLTRNVFRGRLDEWAGGDERMHNFNEVRYFDVEGNPTGLKSRA